MQSKQNIAIKYKIDNFPEFTNQNEFSRYE